MTEMKYSTSSFFAKYRHPKWQQKRLEVMKDAGFACERCLEDDETLNVHHIYYIKGRDPWEYDSSELVCLCESCHLDIHDEEARLQAAMQECKSRRLKYGGDMEGVIGYLVGDSQSGQYRVKAVDDDNWLQGFIYGSHRKSLDSNQIEQFRQLVEADDWHVDYQWVRFFLWDEIPEHLMIDGSRKCCVYWRDGFPEWFANKITRMVRNFKEAG